MLSVGAGIWLYLGGQQKSWALQSWSGETDAERTFDLSRRRRAVIGFVALALAALCQLAVIAW